jgi:hypothetical protein
LLFYALFCFKLFSGAYVSIFQNHYAYLNGNKERAFGGQPIIFLLSVIFLLLSLGSCYYCNDLSLSFLFHFCAKNSL